MAKKNAGYRTSSTNAGKSGSGSLRELLSGRDRRSIARASDVLAMARANIALVTDLAALADDDDWLVAERALDVLAAGLLPHPVVVTHEFALEDYRDAIGTAIDRSSSHAIKVVFRP